MATAGYGRWHPVGAKEVHGRPPVGVIVAYDFRLYRVLEVRDISVIDWDEQDAEAWGNRWEDDPADPEQWKRRPYAVTFTPPSGVGKRRHIKVRDWARNVSWSIMPERHIPLCSECGEPWPCRETLADRAAAEAMARMTDDQQLPDGCCWGCREPITTRQKVITFEGGNLFDPLRSSPSFHLRRECRHEAQRYERRWLEAHPTERARLSCPGHLVGHVEKRRGNECSEGADCPGPLASHRSWEMCYVRHGVCLDGCPLPSADE